MRRSLFLLLLLFYAALAFGQGRHRLFRGLTQAKGLGNTDVKFVYQDQAGFMWLSSLDGLYRFDGNHARLFAPDTVQPHSLYGKMVQSPFFEDGRGDMWFTTEKAINCYRAKTGNFEHYFVRKPDGQMAGDQQHYAFHRDDADGALWVVVADSLYRFDTRHPESAGASAWVCALPRAPRCTFHATEQGMWVVVAFWEYGPGFELLRFDQGGHLQRRDTYLADEQGMKCYKSLVDAQHIIWLATAKGLVRFDVQQPEHWEAFAAPGQKPGVSSVCLYRADRLALATASSQLWLFDTQRKYYVEQQQPMTDDEGVVRPIRTKSVNCTRDGLLWCTEPGGGVYFGRLSAPVFQNLMGDRKSSNADIAQVYEDTQGRVWCSSYTDSTYLFETDGRPCGRFFYPPYTNFFRTAEGKTLCCSNQGIQAMKGQPPTAAASPITPVNNCVVAWKPGTALVGTSQGLFAVQQGKTAPQPIPAAREGVTALSKDRYGRWWVGGSNALQVWEIADDRSTRPIMQLHTRSMVNHIVADALQPDLMWVGTANGLWKIDSRDWSQHPISVGTGGENFVQSVVPDLRGRVWLGTNQGLLRYDPAADPAARLKRYTRNNGLASNEYCRGAALLSRSGHIWMAGKKGVERFHPDSVQDLGSAPRLAVVGLNVHDQPWLCDSVCIERAVRVPLRYNHNTLRLELAALEYTDPEQNQYIVWLSKDQHAPDTVRLGTQCFITYANLSPGTYHFFYTACNAEGIWQNEPRRLDFVISPPFWDTWWFKLLVGFALLSLVGIGTAFYYRYRLRAQQLELERRQREADRKQLLLENELALQQERNRIADEMHDELGGGLSTIRLASERSKRIQSPEELKQILSRVSQISLGLISNMRGIIWAMDTQNDTLDSLLSYLRQFVRTFLDDNAIEAHIQMPMDFPDMSLSGQYRHSILLTVKECLNNVLKHAQASQVWCHVAAGDELVIHIRDNGLGFNPEEKVGSGKGLRTTVKRMESVGGSITWVRNPEGGMTTVLRAPLG